MISGEIGEEVAGLWNFSYSIRKVFGPKILRIPIFFLRLFANFQKVLAMNVP